MKPPILISALAAVALALGGGLIAAPAAHAATCPNPNPVVNENVCQPAGPTAWRLTDHNGNLAGFATKTSVDLGQDVELKIGRTPALPGTTQVDIEVYRMGYYGGAGARLVHVSTSPVTVNNSQTCNTQNATTGFQSCSNWDVTYTIPGAALPASGVYLVKLRATDTFWDNQIIFTVRDDSRSSKLLAELPITTYQAYNNWGDGPGVGKSLYNFNSAGPNTITADRRAVRVSFDRPFINTFDADNWFLKADYPMVYWLEQQGYDVAYTDGPAVHQDYLAHGGNSASALQAHEALVVSGHAEYWSAEELANYKAARDAGVNVASFSANTAFWKVRYEDSGRTVVCYKTVEGAAVPGSAGDGVNDPGPDGIQGTGPGDPFGLDDALGPDGKAHTPDDIPANSSTTFRDTGVNPPTPDLPANGLVGHDGRVGPDTPENTLFGIMFVGENSPHSYPLQVPAASGGEFAGDRIWRRTGLSQDSQTTFKVPPGDAIDSKLVGWEWDAVPNPASAVYAPYAAVQPAGVKRLSASATISDSPEWLQDQGREYLFAPPAGQPGVGNAVKYTAPSGALVFAAGTIQWSWGLGPHWRDDRVTGLPRYTFDPPVDSSDPRIQQATYNIFSDMGVQPDTPDGVTPDAQPANTSAPQVNGTPRDGNTVAGSDGDWTGPAPIDYSRQWRRCDSGGASCLDIGGAGGQAYDLTPADVGHTIRLQVTADNLSPGGAVAASSGPTAVVVAEAPVNTAVPQLSGTALDGQQLDSTSGSWTGTPTISFSRQWRRCDGSGSGCADIANATGQTYTLGSADVGHRLRVAVTAQNPSPSTSTVSSAVSGLVAAIPPANTVPPVIAGTAREGQALQPTSGTWTGSLPLVFSHRWLRCGGTGGGCAEIPGATAKSYLLGAADVGRTIRVRVTAVNAAPAGAAATSEATATIAVSAPAVPAGAGRLPRARGGARVGVRLHATRGEWSGGAVQRWTYRWLRCSSRGRACRSIRAATGTRYRLRRADAGRRLRVSVTAVNESGSATATSAATRRVAR